jgi:hypothetical protein
MGHSKCTRSALCLFTGVPFLFVAESAMIQIFWRIPDVAGKTEFRPTDFLNRDFATPSWE